MRETQGKWGRVDLERSIDPVALILHLEEVALELEAQLCALGEIDAQGAV